MYILHVIYKIYIHIYIHIYIYIYILETSVCYCYCKVIGHFKMVHDEVVCFFLYEVMLDLHQCMLRPHYVTFLYIKVT